MESEATSSRGGAMAGSSSGATSRSGEQTNSNTSASGTEATTSTTPTSATTSSSRSRDRTLDDVMRDPSTALPGVVVLESMPEGLSRKEVLDPRQDLWLSTADGRFSSPVIPLHVGVEPHKETFYVHKNVLIKSKYFERALCGDFMEARTQAVDLPEENPAIFHFLIAYLYEGKYHPIKPAASVLVADPDKGKRKEGSQETGGDSDSDESVDSHNSDAPPPAGPHPAPPPPPPPPHVGAPPARIAGEDLRTWLLAYELTLDVYILANKFLLDGFKAEIARAAIDMLETAGSDAAVPDVLYLCRKLYDGLSEGDSLLRMIFARVGFLQPWLKSPDETSAFLVANPAIAPLLLREMASRRTDEASGRALPSMERPWFPPAGSDPGAGPNYLRGPPPHHPAHFNRGPPRW